MGHLLRACVSRRISKLLFEWGLVDTERYIQQIPRLFSSQKLKSGEDSDIENKLKSLTSVDKRFYEDLNKFQNENKILLPRSAVKSEDFVAGPQDDPNVFGTLQSSNPYIESLKEGAEDDQMEDMYSSELPDYLPQKEYAKQIKKFLAQRRFAEALDVLQVTMIKEHRVKPAYNIYAILISYCGRTGYSKMASKLYNDMKKRGLTVTNSIYTSLFNSFANSPFPSDGLKRTVHLFSLMNEKGIPPNDITCHAVIKAFAKCGSLEEAFKVVDYMMDRKLQLTPDTMNNLLLACRADRKAGFRNALLIYRKLIQYRLTPDIYHFNLLINCVRDCSIGDIDSTVDMLKMIGVENADEIASKTSKVPLLDSGYAWEENEKVAAETVAGLKQGSLTQLSSSSETNLHIDLLPNLFLRQPTLGCLVSITEIATRQDRLFLLGGVEGFLKEMSSYNVKPDIRTANLLLDCIQESCVAEKHLLKVISKLDVTPDLVFYNTLIVRRVRRQQYSEAKDVLSMITSQGLQPDLHTYTNLAMTCRTISDAYELLQSLDASGLRPGIEFVTSMFGCAMVYNDMKYVQLVLDVIKYEEMEVNSVFMKKIESFYNKCLKIIKIRPEKFTPRSLDAMQKFCKMYPNWKADVNIEKESHPWQQFKEKYPENSKTDAAYLKNHVEPHALKPKFPRLGPTAGPILRKAKLKKLRKENPEMFEGNTAAKKVLNKLQGFESVVIQNNVAKN